MAIRSNWVCLTAVPLKDGPDYETGHIKDKATKSNYKILISA